MGGRTVDSPDGPDGAVCIFPRIGDALTAACALQQALGEQALPICLALHIGWASPGAGDYAGPARQRTARLARLGHPGQILVTQATVNEVQGALPEGLRLREVGRHPLSVVERPQPIYQVLHPLRLTAFPPLRSPVVPPTNLPPQLSSFVGRELELAAVGELLRQAPLVTLVGAGDVGKTRLALAAAAELLEGYADGAWLVELAALADPGLARRRWPGHWGCARNRAAAPWRR